MRGNRKSHRACVSLTLSCLLYMPVLPGQLNISGPMSVPPAVDNPAGMLTMESEADDYSAVLVPGVEYARYGA